MTIRSIRPDAYLDTPQEITEPEKHQPVTSIEANSVSGETAARTFNYLSTPIPISRKFHAPIANLLRNASTFKAGVNRLKAEADRHLDTVKKSTADYLAVLRENDAQLKTGRANLNAASAPTELLESIDRLSAALARTICGIGNGTNDLLYNLNNSMKGMAGAAAKFSLAARRLSGGDAAAMVDALNFFQQSRTSKAEIVRLSSEHGDAIKGLVAPLADEARSAVSLFDSLSHPAAGSVRDIARALTATDIAHELAEQNYKFSYKVDNLTPFVSAYYLGLQGLWQKIFLPDLNPRGKPIAPQRLIENTTDLRDKIAAAQGGDAKALADLKRIYGYTLETAPKPGNMLLAANFVAGDLDNGLVTARRFPGSAQPVDTDPPTVDRLLFGKKSDFSVRAANGSEKRFSSMKEYQAYVAANRARVGIPEQNGEPVRVHVTFEGGGGFGKRHAPALGEMYNLGIVPASVSGVSAGAITAGLIAAGLNPLKADEVSKDPAIQRFFDTNVSGPGILAGREFYRYMDEKLCAITGIKDRPVTFADLPMPLYINATKLADSNAPNDMTNFEDRVFVFSKETTPDTPVAMAMTASAAVPGSFDPVDFIDVATGRTIRLVDGGIIDNLPVGYQRNNLPEIAIQLNEPNNNDPETDVHKRVPNKLPAGDLISNSSFGNAQIGIKLYKESGEEARNFLKRNNPQAGLFVLNVPVWNLKNFVKQDSIIDYKYNREIDPELDRQTVEITDNFFRKFFTRLNDARASGTNLQPFPGNGDFSRTFMYEGREWTAGYEAGSGKLLFNSEDGEQHRINFEDSKMRAWLADDASFGDLQFRLRDVLADHERYLRAYGIF